MPFALILLLTCYTVYLGLDSEYGIMHSDEFAGWLARIEAQEDIAPVVGRAADSGDANVVDDRYGSA